MRFEAVSRRSSLEQLLPPLLIFLVLLARDGTTLLVGAALAALALAVSLVRLARLAVRKPAPGTRRLRSVLTIVFAAAVLVVSWLQVAPTYFYADGLARHLQKQCVAQGSCPARIASWPAADGATGSDATMGKRVRYALAYRTDGATFRVCWVVAFGRCRSAMGGAQVPLQPMRPWPWPQSGAGGEAP